MIKMIEKIVSGRWFKEPSPFCCNLTPGNEKLCVITGPNVSGKSLLRKILHFHHKDQNLGDVCLSQEGRSTSTGLARVALYGSEEDDSTGYNSVRMVVNGLKQNYKTPFGLMFDEPEIGCSEEVQAGIGQRIVRDIDKVPTMHGMYIITHSRELVRQLLVLKPTHFRLANDGLTLENFVSRPVVPVVDLEAIVSLGSSRWQMVSAMLKNKH